jgi:hypothetical protein
MTTTPQTRQGGASAGQGGASAGAGQGGAGGSAGTAGSGAGEGGTAGGGTAGGGGNAGGSAGAGGSGGGATCGNGVLDEGEVCDAPFTENDCGADCGPITSPECLECEETEPSGECITVVDCSDVAGNATSGPATGVARAYLCNETLHCIRQSGCAGGQLIDCYCGTATSAECDSGQGNGLCREQLERGFETTNPVEITNRYTNPEFAAGFAMLRVGCDQAYCMAECF